MNKNFEILGADENLNRDDFYQRFKEKLEETHSFPTNYLFKYVAPSEQSILVKIYSAFENAKGSISTKESKNGKYTSVTIKVPVNSADEVIAYYQEAEKIDGIMAL